MSDSARVQRWREGKRQDGLKAITIAQWRSILLRKAMHALKFYI